MTASELLARIESDFFRKTDLAEASRLSGEERRAFRLRQTERLLTEKNGPVSLAMYLSDMFWTADEGRTPIKDRHPLLTAEEWKTLNDEERAREGLIEEIAGLCHDLALHFTFDVKEAFGIRRSDLWVSNKQLVEWLSATAYEQIAAHTAYTMKKHAISVYDYGHYLPAQDELAELWSTEHHCLVGRPDSMEMPPGDYVMEILDALQRIERHWQRGLKRLKLRPDLIMLHDEIYGVMPLRFDRGVLKAAQALYDYMDREVCGKRTTAEVMRRFAEKVREVRSEYLAKGWITDDSLAFSYLMAHAERCAQGWWREEDEAL